MRRPASGSATSSGGDAAVSDLPSALPSERASQKLVECLIVELDAIDDVAVVNSCGRILRRLAISNTRRVRVKVLEVMLVVISGFQVPSDEHHTEENRHEQVGVYIADRKVQMPSTRPSRDTVSMYGLRSRPSNLIA